MQLLESYSVLWSYNAEGGIRNSVMRAKTSDRRDRPGEMMLVSLGR